MTPKPSNVLIVGGGPAGLAMGALLARSGARVRIVEASPSNAPHALQALRSINLALSSRGLRTLEALGLGSRLANLIIPMRGRAVHSPGGFGPEFQTYDLVGTQAILSIRRDALWWLLREEAERAGVDLQFARECRGIDLAARTIWLSDGSGATLREHYDALIGADGVHSVVRKAIAADNGGEAEAGRLPHSYVQLNIPACRAKPLRTDALHIWPRGNRMLVALPNVDGSFTATLFWPEPNASSGADAREALASLFQRDFGEATNLVPDWSAGLSTNPIGRLHRCTCESWIYGDSVVLIGDAAHAMAPFFGQGLNCALEDCLVLAEEIARCDGVLGKAFSSFARGRPTDAETIARLSDSNYAEMSRDVVDQGFRRRRDVERTLQTHFPESFTPLYAMIAFSTLPYAQAMDRQRAWQPIVDRLALQPVISEDQIQEAGRTLRALAAGESVRDTHPPEGGATAKMNGMAGELVDTVPDRRQPTDPSAAGIGLWARPA